MQKIQKMSKDRQKTQQEYDNEKGMYQNGCEYGEENSEQEDMQSNPDMQELLREEAELKKKYPEFDLRYMLKTNEGFAKRMLRGYTMEDAYILAINEKGKRGIRENGTRPSAGAVTRRDPRNMSDGDFKKYIDNLMNR